MPRILEIATAVPPHRVRQKDVREQVRRLFSRSKIEIDKLMPVFENTTTDTRHFCVPPEWFEKDRGFAEKNAVFQEWAVRLSEQALRDVCRAADVDPMRIDHIFFISTTGISTPSIDAHLLNSVPFHSSILRTPIWGLGCAGGVAGIGRAADWLRAYPRAMAAVVSVELCGLTFIRDDLSRSNFVATSLFADGCAAALLAGHDNPARTPRMLAVERAAAHTWSDSLDVMGWDVRDQGLKVVFSRSIPHLVSRDGRAVVEKFLGDCGLDQGEIAFFLSHPGGAKIIEAYKAALGLAEPQIRFMREVIRDFGNMSSATVFFVLRRFLDSEDFRDGVRALSTALGPGFSSEFALLRCAT